MNESESINLKGGNEKVGDTKSLIFELFDYISSLGAIEKRDVHVCVFMTFRQLLSILVLSLFTKLRKLFVGRYTSTTSSLIKNFCLHLLIMCSLPISHCIIIIVLQCHISFGTS